MAQLSIQQATDLVTQALAAAGANDTMARSVAAMPAGVSFTRQSDTIAVTSAGIASSTPTASLAESQ